MCFTWFENNFNFSSREVKGKWFPIGLNQLNYYKDISCSNCKLTDFCMYNKNVLTALNL